MAQSPGLDISITLERPVYHFLHLLAISALLLPLLCPKRTGRFPGWMPLLTSVICALLASSNLTQRMDVPALFSPVHATTSSNNTSAFVVTGTNNTTADAFALSLFRGAENPFIIIKLLAGHHPLPPVILGAAIVAAMVVLLSAFFTMALLLGRRRGWFARRTFVGNAVRDAEQMVEIYGSDGVGRREYQYLSARLGGEERRGEDKLRGMEQLVWGLNGKEKRTWGFLAMGVRYGLDDKERGSVWGFGAVGGWVMGWVG